MKSQTCFNLRRLPGVFPDKLLSEFVDSLLIQLSSPGEYRKFLNGLLYNISGRISWHTVGKSKKILLWFLRSVFLTVCCNICQHQKFSRKLRLLRVDQSKIESSYYLKYIFCRMFNSVLISLPLYASFGVTFLPKMFWYLFAWSWFCLTSVCEPQHRLCVCIVQMHYQPAFS